MCLDISVTYHLQQKFLYELFEHALSESILSSLLSDLRINRKNGKIFTVKFRAVYIFQSDIVVKLHINPFLNTLPFKH